MLTIWSTVPQSKVLNNLSPVLRSCLDLPVSVVTPGQIPDGTQIILALGTAALESLQAAKTVAKNRTVTSLRTAFLNHANTVALVSYSPDIGEKNWSYHTDLLTDTTLAVRYALTGAKTPIFGQYGWYPDFGELCGLVEQQHHDTGRPVDLCFDTETLGLDPYALPNVAKMHPGAYIVMMQATHQAGRAWAIKFCNRLHEEERLFDPALSEQLEFLLNAPYIRLRGANLKYDQHWMWVRAKKRMKAFCFDSTIVGSLLDENRSNALDVHVKIYVPSLAGYSDEFDRTVDKSRMDKVPDEQLLPYGCGDVDGGLQVAEATKQELLKDPQLTAFYCEILHPAAKAFTHLEQTGVLVDQNAVQELKSDLEAEQRNLIKQACGILGGRLVAKHLDTTKVGGINLTKASLLKDFMFGPMGLNLKPKMFTPKPDKFGIPVPATSMEHLEMFADHPDAGPLVGVLKEYASCVKTYGTYVVGFMEHLRSDGRFHPNYFLYAGNHDEGEGGTNTGRLSCKDPAFQCMVGETLIKTSLGLKRLDWLVDQNCEGVRVLTHTGRWRKIVGTYRNGVHPVFEVRLSNGREIVCTGNHPILTNRGWVRCDDLKVGDTGYVDSASWPSDPAVYQPDILQLGGNEESLQQSNVEGLGELRGKGNQGLSSLDDLRVLFEGHGREAGAGVVHRAEECERRLRTRQLPVGEALPTESESKKQQVDNVSGRDQNRGRVGERVWGVSGKTSLPSVGGGADGTSLDEAEAPDRSAFKEAAVVSITPVGSRETFDLTIEGSHSFVANGVVVHNTIPKHTKWAKRIRRCYIAPPGYLVMERDYSQGELRVVACIANEANMIAAYRAGMDLHAKTGGERAGLTYDEMMLLKVQNEELFGEYRQLAKAMNFGLLYGMGAEGFLEYAVSNYGVKGLTLAMAEEARTAFFVSYPGLLTYHAVYKEFARKNGYVRGPLGRIRHLPLINSPMREVASKEERRAINSPVQGTLSDMLLWSFALEAEAGLIEIAPAFGAIHDAAYNYVPEEANGMDAVDIARKHIEIQENLPFERVGWYPQLRFPADAKLGPNMAELKAVKFPQAA